MEPIVNGLETELDGQIAFERSNANTVEGKALMEAFKLRGHPSLVIVTPEGDRLWSSSGFMNAELLRSQIDQSLKPAQ